MNPSANSDISFSKRDIVSASITILSLVLAVLIEARSASSPLISKPSIVIMLGLDTLACVYFWWEFLDGLKRAINRREYAIKNVYSLLGAIPMVPTLRFLRILRLTRLFRFIRLTAILVRFWNTWIGQVSSNSLSAIGGTALVVLILGSSAVWFLEAPYNHTINSYFDAVWFTIVTATTVGYGDMYPITIQGKIVAILVFITGIGLVGSFTAAIASKIIRDPQDGSVDLTDLNKQLEAMQHKQDQIIKQLNSLTGSSGS